MQTSLKHLKSRGFTIVELLIVIVVIGILAALTIIGYNGVQAKAIDRSVQSDADSLEGLETRYATTNSAGGKVWYSGISGTNGAADSSLGLTPTKGNVIDVVVDSANTGYCIRIFNSASSTYKTLSTAYQKESTPGVCAATIASTAVYTDTGTPLPPPYYTTSFESGFDGWSSGHGSNVVSLSTTKARTGTTSVKSVQNTFWYVNDATHCGSPSASCGFLGDGLRKTLSGATIGQNYILTAYVYTDDTAYPRNAVWNYNGSGAPTPLVVGTWTKITKTITATGTSPYVYLFIQRTGTQSTDVVTTYIDDITAAKQ
jgi:prepilin-type N-terminal cleavage/methylation domain-containing protein